MRNCYFHVFVLMVSGGAVVMRGSEWLEVVVAKLPTVTFHSISLLFSLLTPPLLFNTKARAPRLVFYVRVVVMFINGVVNLTEIIQIKLLFFFLISEYKIFIKKCKILAL